MLPQKGIQEGKENCLKPPNVRKPTPLKSNKKVLLIDCCKPGLNTRSQFQENE